MRRAALYLSMLAMLAGLGVAAAKPRASSPAQQPPNGPPHAWLFGTWTGGLFPVLDGMTAEDCRTQPTVRFSKDIVAHANLLGGATTQQTIVTVRTTPTGAEFHFVPGATASTSFGCEDPALLHVTRESNNTISFPHCTAYPYPLERCSP
jgi:hypothetical protein